MMIQYTYAMHVWCMCTATALTLQSFSRALHVPLTLVQVRYCTHNNSNETQHMCFQCRLAITNAMIQPARHTWSPNSRLANRLTSGRDAFHRTIFDALLYVTYYVIVTSTAWSRLRLLLLCVFVAGEWIYYIVRII